jgi:hypothetical protein
MTRTDVAISPSARSAAPLSSFPEVGETELSMARAALRVGALLALPLVVGALVLRGTAGAVTALGAVAFVSLNFYATGRSLRWAAQQGPVVLQAVALGGFLARLGLYGVMLVLLRPVEAIDGPVLAISAAIALIVVLAFEVRLVTADPRIWFVDVSARSAAPLLDTNARSAAPLLDTNARSAAPLLDTNARSAAPLLDDTGQRPSDGKEGA